MKLTFEQRTRVPHVPGWALVLVVGWFGGVAFMALLGRLYGTPTVPCHFRLVTGVPCATCGSTRAGVAMLEGRIVDALLINPLIIGVSFAGALVVGMRLITARQVVIVTTRRERIGLWVLAFFVFAANWAYVISRHAA